MRYTTSQVQSSTLVEEARRHPTIIEGADGGENLVLKSESDEHAQHQIVRLYAMLRAVETAFRDGPPARATLGDLEFLAGWDADRRRWFFDGLAESLAVGTEANDAKPALFFIDYCRPKGHATPESLDPLFLEGLGAALSKRNPA